MKAEEILAAKFNQPETQDWYKPVLAAMEEYASVASSQHKPDFEDVEAGKADKENEPVELQERANEYVNLQGVSYPMATAYQDMVRSQIFKAYLDGASTQSDRIKELEAENEILKMENSHSKLVVDEAKREIDRLRGLVEEAYKTLMIWKPNSITAEEDWQKFKANNNL